jgi:hypothetical protein
MTAPTFVAHFNDGTQTRMTTHCSPDKLNLRRGIVLSRIAYQSRRGFAPPPITKASFETIKGTVLREYDEKELEAAS